MCGRGTEGCGQCEILMIGGRLDWIISEVFCSRGDSMTIYEDPAVSNIYLPRFSFGPAFCTLAR